MALAERIAAHTGIAAALATLDDRDLADLLASARPAGTGIGGRSLLLEADGGRVFVKRVPLTDLERLPRHVRSTADVFALPPHLHYGVGALGSPGFGAWRELAVHTMTTDWVLAGRFPGFPLLHHWRVLPSSPQPLPDELADVDRAVDYWKGDGDGARVRARIEGLRTATACLTLFLEYVPHTLHDWLGRRLRTDRADAACRLVARQLGAATRFLHEHGLLHCDAHFGNILTDGRRLYLTDFGLSLASGFRLAPDECDFLDRHRGYDGAYAATYLVNWLVTAIGGHDLRERRALVRALAEGARPDGAVPPAAAAILTRHAPLAARMNDFHDRLRRDSRLTPYPHDELRRAYSSATLSA
ncbi:protein kinase domain-containing protein [Streptomyces carpinensis]|uniref:Protein kinase family protein n=1 Tax=Streptomyces carpinensis TaxID=66369 RepID=A0ABV1WGK6_9ACTN|nr:protein kinase family protein [Streptomyces carpinensis]